jgi:hypothetical protein
MLLNLKKHILQFCLLCHCVWSFISKVTNYRIVTPVEEHIWMFLRLYNNELHICGQMFGIRSQWSLLLFFWTSCLEMHILEDLHLTKFSDFCLSMYTVVALTLYTLQWCQQKWNHGNLFIKIPTVIQIHLIYKHIHCYFHGLNWQDKVNEVDVDNKVTVLLHVVQLHTRTCCVILFPPQNLEYFECLKS